MTMPSKRSGGCGIDPERWVSRESVRKPWAIGTPHGDISLQASGSTWMNWWSSVTSANVLIRSWVTSNHSPVPSDSPTAASNSLYASSPLLTARPLASISVEPRMPDRSDRRDDRYRPEEHEQRVGACTGGLQRRDQHLHRHRHLVEHQLDDRVRRGAAGGRARDQRALLRRRRGERELLRPPRGLRHARPGGVPEQGAGTRRDRDELAVDPDEQARLAGASHALR